MRAHLVNGGLPALESSHMNDYDPEYHTWCPIDPSVCNRFPTAEALIEHIVSHDRELVAQLLIRERYINRLITGAIADLERRSEEQADRFLPDPLNEADMVYEIQFEEFERHKEPTENKQT